MRIWRGECLARYSGRIVIQNHLPLDLSLVNQKYCRICGYDLRGISAEGCCPECGKSAANPMGHRPPRTAICVFPILLVTVPICADALFYVMLSFAGLNEVDIIGMALMANPNYASRGIVLYGIIIAGWVPIICLVMIIVSAIIAVRVYLTGWRRACIPACLAVVLGFGAWFCAFRIGMLLVAA